MKEFLSQLLLIDRRSILTILLYIPDGVESEFPKLERTKRNKQRFPLEEYHVRVLAKSVGTMIVPPDIHHCVKLC